MKYITLCCCLFLMSLQSNAQSPKLSIHSIPPKIFTVGESHVLKVSVMHNLKTEHTGNLTLSLLNHATQKSVDGWFLNVFPFQYFTTILNTAFEAEFPFTVPDAYEGKFDIVLVAEVNKIKDSVRFIIPTKKK